MNGYAVCMKSYVDLYRVSAMVSTGGTQLELEIGIAL